MTSTTSIRQEVLLPTLDQHFQYRQENDNSAQIQQRGSYSDNEDGNTLQPLSDQQRQAPGAQERDSPVPRSCGCNSCRRSNSRNKISADTPPRPPSHQQQQLSQQEQYGTTVVSSTQQDSWIRPGSRSSLELPILSPKPSRPSSSLSPCFPTYTYSPTTIATATRFGFSLSDQPDISTTTPPLTPELPQPHQQHIVVVVTPAPDAAVTPLMSLPPSPSPSFPSDPLFPLISSSSSFPASSLFKTTNTSQGPHPTATASSLSTGQHTVQHTASTAKAATSPSPPISHLQRVQSLSRPQSTHSNQSFLTSSYLSSTSFSSAASSFISSSTSISSPSPGPGLAIRTQTLASTPSCASSSSSPSSSPRSSTECHCSSCSDWQTSIAPKAQSLGPLYSTVSSFTPSPSSPLPVSATARVTTATSAPVPVATTVTITPTNITCRCTPEKLASCPHQLSFLVPAAAPYQLSASPEPLPSAEIQPLRYFRPETLNDNNSADNSQAARNCNINNNYYCNTVSSNDAYSSFPTDLEDQVRNSLDYLCSLETHPPSDQEDIKKTPTKRKKRPQSWIALKEFVSSRILGLHKDRDSSSSRQQECPTPSDRPPILLLHNRNHSTPLLDNSHRQRREFLLRSPSPSPSLPISSTHPLSTPNSFSRVTSRLFLRPRSQESQQQQQPPCARADSPADTSRPSSSQDNHYRHSFAGHDSTRPSMRDWTTTSQASIRAPGSRPTSPQPSAIVPTSSSSSPCSSPRSSSPPPHSYLPYQRSPRSDYTTKVATFGPSTSFSQLQSRFESSASVSSAGSASTSSLASYNHPPLSQPQPSTSMSNYASSSMSSLSTISATSNVYPPSSPSPSNVSLYPTSPRSPLRKSTAGGQHPLATVSTFESDPTTTSENAVETMEADTSRTLTLPSGVEQATEASSTPSDSHQVTLGESVPSTDDVQSIHPKAFLLNAGSQTGSSLKDKKQDDMRTLKNAVLSGSHNILMLQIKSGTQPMDPELAATAGLDGHHDGSESDWASVAVTSGDGQPLSPLTASYPVSIRQPVALASTTSVDFSSERDVPTASLANDTVPATAPPAQAPTTTTPATATSPPTGTSTTSTTPPLGRHEFEKWTPPPPKPRPTQDTHRAQPQSHSRLHFPRLLKQRSFNFPFSTSSSSLSSSASGSSSRHQSGSASTPAARASVDGSSQAAGSRVDGQDPAARTASCDIPRPVGPPDPIPLHYQHLQNRPNRRSSFRRRSHAGELEHFSPGWVVVENNSNQSGYIGGATTPTRVSMSADDQVAATSPSSENHQRRSSATTTRRHASLGVQPNLTSMWGRLLTSILPSGNDHQHHAQESDNAPSRDLETPGVAQALSGDIDPYLQQQRLLLTPLSQQQQIHPLYQQQLFFYADEVVNEPRRTSESDLPYFQTGAEDASSQPRRSMANESLRRVDSPSFFPALAHNAHLQGELAQEDGRESLEMSSTDAAAFMRPSLDFSGPAVMIGGVETYLAPRSLSADGKIPVSSLALSQPPSYWEAQIKYKGFPKIEPRPEQGNEALPRYTCSVFREGCVNRKTELVGNWRPYRRPWKRTFAHLRGTALRLYAVDMEDVPCLHVRNISLQLAKCEIATDYKQRSNVIRIRACDRTVLLECKDRIDALTWLEHLQAAANIATSLEDRSMPKFYTLPRAPPQHSQSQQNGQGGNRSAASSSVSNRNHQQTPQPLPQSMPSSSSSSTHQQRRASVVLAVASPRSSTEVDAGADAELRVRRSRSGGLLTRSGRTGTMTERDRRNEAAAAELGEEAVLRNVLRALGHTPDLGSPSTEEEIDSDNDEDDGQGTDAEASPAAAAAAAVASQGTSAARRRRSAGRRCTGSCHHHHGQSHGHSHRHHHRGHHHHDHNTTIIVAAGPNAATSGVATDDEARGGGRGDSLARMSEDHPDHETTATTRGYHHAQPVTTAAAATSSVQTTMTAQRQQQQQRASWNRRIFGGLWGGHHGQQRHQDSSTSSSLQHTNSNPPTPLVLAAAT